MAWGPFAVFPDPEGNRYGLREKPDETHLPAIAVTGRVRRCGWISLRNEVHFSRNEFPKNSIKFDKFTGFFDK